MLLIYGVRRSFLLLCGKWSQGNRVRNRTIIHEAFQWPQCLEVCLGVVGSNSHLIYLEDRSMVECEYEREVTKCYTPWVKLKGQNKETCLHKLLITCKQQEKNSCSDVSHPSAQTLLLNGMNVTTGGKRMSIHLELESQGKWGTSQHWSQ